MHSSHNFEAHAIANNVGGPPLHASAPAGGCHSEQITHEKLLRVQIRAQCLRMRNMFRDASHNAGKSHSL